MNIIILWLDFTKTYLFGSYSTTYKASLLNKPMSWGKNTSKILHYKSFSGSWTILPSALDLSSRGWIFVAGNPQFAGKSFDLIVEVLWKWGLAPVINRPRRKIGNCRCVSASNPWEKDRCMLKHSAIYNPYIYIHMYIYIHILSI